VFFAAVRFSLAACLFIPVMRSVGAAFAKPLIGRVVLTGILLNVVTYGLLFWGMKYVPSGIAGATNLSVVAIGSFGFAVMFGQQRPDKRYLLALIAGVAGLFVVFSKDLNLTGRMSELIGAGAIIVGTLGYCLGSVLAKPLMSELEPRQLTAAHAIVGAIGLTGLSLAIEPVSLDTVRALIQPGPLAGLLFLVIFGTYMAYTIYLRLVRDWGAPRAGLYAFISPIFALVLGHIVYAEPLGITEALGVSLMLIGAGFALKPPIMPAPRERSEEIADPARLPEKR
jgi:drug/metabolite transporter (DMT)-like permease